MTIRTASLISAIVLAGAAAPVAAREDHGRYEQHPGAVAEGGTWQGEWSGEWESEDSYIGVWRGTFTGLDGERMEGEYRGRFVGESRFVTEDGRSLYRDDERGWREYDTRYAGSPPPAKGGPQFGYSEDQRFAWLEQCRSAYQGSYSGYGYGAGRRRGAAIGGVLGAAAGGLAGNRIADGSRLAGTVIGAGVGAVTGAVIGSAVGGAADRRRAGQYDACEEYLDRYEQSYGGYGSASHYGSPYAPVVWVRVPIMRSRSGDCGCEEVVEVVEEVVTYHEPARRRVMQPVKRVPVKQVKYIK